MSILKSSEDLFELNLEADKVRLRPSSSKLERDPNLSDLTNKEEEEKKEAPLLPEIKGIVVDLGGESSWVRVDRVDLELRYRHDTHARFHGYKRLIDLIASYAYFDIIALERKWLVRMKSDEKPSELTKEEEENWRIEEEEYPSTTKTTSSFGVLWAGNFTELQHENIQIHTLILGTHPSITSLEENRYFGHPMNAFWWIAGDCLGFRRNDGLSVVTGQPFKFTSELRYGQDRVIPYQDQIRIFASKGFALWDVVKECQREGSLDSAIKGDVPNDIRGFCEQHPSIHRIILANGGTSCTIFNKHFTDWWLSGDLKPGTNYESIIAFGKFGKLRNLFGTRRIECISAISVSPAAARYSFSEKRLFWEEFVYGPGLNAHKENSAGSPKSVRNV
jgi:G:T/U-mismatch repair DNA glycosylase